MTKRARFSLVAMGIALTVLPGSAAIAAPTPQQKCTAARIKLWRTYTTCIDKVLFKHALDPLAQLFEPFAKCRYKYFSKWATLQGGAYTGSSCIGSRFTDNGDGTVTDNLSALTWEKKTDDGGVHDKDNNVYTWSTGAPFYENGTVFTSFLNTVNGGGGFGGANGWRLPTLAELQTIMLDFPCTATSCTCPSSPCVDPALDTSNTLAGLYWSATTDAPSPSLAWFVQFFDGEVTVISKTFFAAGRAVRGGL